MITRPTVLILGAGASVYYGFPTGRRLLDNICVALEGGYETQFGRRLLATSRVKPQEMVEFREHLYKSAKQSVDAFLERRPEFLTVGKLAIAQALVPYEDPNELVKRGRQPDSWYQLLFNSLDSRFDEFPQNKLGVLTYNYDRSLEEFLFTSLKHAHNRSDAETEAALEQIPIVHLHGQLGIHPHYALGDQIARPYYNDVDQFATAVGGIKIVHEVEPTDPEFTRARKMLSEAKRVCFLGFGYDPINIRRLQLENTGCSFYGTTFGMGTGQIDAAFSLLPGSPSRKTIGSSSHDCYSFLREFTDLS